MHVTASKSVKLRLFFLFSFFSFHTTYGVL